MLMNNVFYMKEMTSALSRDDLFETTVTDALSNCILVTKDLLSWIWLGKVLSKEVISILEPQANYRVPPIYGLPKIHKTGPISMKPIVAGNGHPCEGISIFLDTILQPFAKKGKYYIIDGLFTL